MAAVARPSAALVAPAPAETIEPAGPPAGHAAERASGNIVYPLLGLGLFQLQVLAMIFVWAATRG